MMMITIVRYGRKKRKSLNRKSPHRFMCGNIKKVFLIRVYFLVLFIQLLFNTRFFHRKNISCNIHYNTHSYCTSNEVRTVNTFF